MKTIKAFIKKHPVLTYFALTFAISWGGVLLVIGGPSGIPGTPEQFERLLPFAIPVMIVGPGVAGLLLTGLVQGRAGFRELLSRLLKWRVGARWYAVAFVFHYFRKWRLDGTWERLNRTIRERLRVRLGRDPQPSAGIVDSQSAKTTGVGGEQRGFDGGKQVRGRKRHILVDTEGMVIEARVHSAKVPDQDGIRRLLEPAARDWDVCRICG